MGKIKGLVTEMGEYKAGEYLREIKGNISNKKPCLKKINKNEYILEKDTEFPRQPKPQGE